MTSLYHEIHVTIALPDLPLTGPQWHRNMKDWAKSVGWSMGDLFMIKGARTLTECSEDWARNDKDVFFTTRAANYELAKVKVAGFCHALKALGYEPIRYKIEDTVLDSKIEDELGILGVLV